VEKQIAVVFDSNAAATAGLRVLWQLDAGDKIIVHGAAVVKRDQRGDVRVAAKSTDPRRTAMGIGVGALVGTLAVPIAVAAGLTVASSIAAATAAGRGAAAVPSA